MDLRTSNTYANNESLGMKNSSISLPEEIRKFIKGDLAFPSIHNLPQKLMLNLLFCNGVRRAIQPCPSTHCLSRSQTKPNRDTHPNAQRRQQNVLLFHHFRPPPNQIQFSPKKAIPLLSLSNLHTQTNRKQSSIPRSKQATVVYTLSFPLIALLQYSIPHL